MEAMLSSGGLSGVEILAALGTLTILEIVLGIDNVVFIAILCGKLPPGQQAKARRLGLLLAMVLRLVLLALAWLVIQLEQPLFTLPLLQETVHDAAGAEITRGVGISVKDLILLAGGLFLIAKAVHEMHRLVEGDHAEAGKKAGSTMVSVLGQILLLDLVFSIDSVITAVGMTRVYWIMAAAVVVSVGVMMLFAGPIANFVSRHPTMKTLALAFLVLIGVLLVADGLHQHFSRNYVYFAMGFALGVELLNLQIRKRARKHQTA